MARGYHRSCCAVGSEWVTVMVELNLYSIIGVLIIVIRKTRQVIDGVFHDIAIEVTYFAISISGDRLN